MRLEKLADDTKKNLEGMNLFVGQIHETANEGKTSMDSTIDSTGKMSSQIDEVIVTIEGNVQMLNDSIRNIKDINISMSGIKTATNEINAAMDASSQDAESLSDMTIKINEYALKSKEYAKTIADIDNKLSLTTKDMMHALSGGKNALGNKDILVIVENALVSHQKWVNNLEDMVNNMEVKPIQTDGNRCAFGHYYNSIVINNPKIKDLWKSIDTIHHDFHKLGQKTLDAIKVNDRNTAIGYLNNAKERSKEIHTILGKIKSILNEDI